MTRVLVTGGRGILGSHLVPRLQAEGVTVRVGSRQPAPADKPAALEWTQADMVETDDLAPAVAGVDVIIHAATNALNNSRVVEEEGTRRLLQAAAQAGVRHFVYVSIVGVEKIPYYYYQAKLAAEQVVEQGSVPWTILRAAQFHDLLDIAAHGLKRLPVWPLPLDMQVQPIDSGETATRLVELALAAPVGRAPDIAGPRVMRTGEVIRQWLRATGTRRPVIHLPLPGKVAAGFRRGYNTAPDRAYGKITWEQWLAQKYQTNAAQAGEARRQGHVRG